MAELICTYCGTSNTVHSEYLILCGGCGKKLKGSFQEWKTTHPAGTFQQYLDQLTAAGEAEQKSRVVQSITRSRARIAGWTTAIVLLAAMTLGYLYVSGIWQPGKSSMYATSREVLEREWTRYTCGQFGLSVELPGKPVKVTEEESQGVEKEQFIYHPEKGFQAELTGLRMTGKQLDLENATNQLISRIAGIPGVSNVKFQAAPLMSDQIPGVLLTGTLDEDGSSLDFHCAVFVRSANSWSVVVRHLSGDPVGAECAEKLIDSIEINYFASPV